MYSFLSYNNRTRIVKNHMAPSKSSMTKTTILYGVITLLLLLYIGYRLYQHKRNMEYFQQADSVYFQSTVDGDDSEQGPDKAPRQGRGISWNGIWENKKAELHATFFQMNDLLYMSLSTSSFDTVYYNQTQENDNSVDKKCPSNLFIGIGQLNLLKNSFILQKVLCSNFATDSFTLMPNHFRGELRGDEIRLDGKISLTRKRGGTKNNEVYQMHEYIRRNAPFLTFLPSIEESEWKHEEITCPVGSSPCMNIENGIALTTYNDITYNACGAPISEEDATCGTTECLFFSGVNTGIPTCKIEKKTHDTNNFSLFGALSTRMCTFFPTQGLTYIICYITNIGNVQTLNYQYFGAIQNNITTQYDRMNHLLNECIKSDTAVNFLPFYRNTIANADGGSSPSHTLIDAISFTNSFEQRDALNKCKKYVTDYAPSPSNDALEPALWDIRVDSSLPSCPVQLKTSALYKGIPVKYAIHSPSERGVKMSIYGGEYPFRVEEIKTLTPLTHNENASNASGGATRNFLAFTANIRCIENGQYMIPQLKNSGFSSSSSVVGLQNEPQPNGKWLFIGLKLNTIGGLQNALKELCVDFAKSNKK